MYFTPPLEILPPPPPPPPSPLKSSILTAPIVLHPNPNNVSKLIATINLTGMGVVNN